VGNVRAEDIRTVTGNRTLLNPFAVNHSQVTGHRYGADIAGVLCHGPIDELMDLQFQDVSLRKYAADNTNYVMGPSGSPVLTTPMTPGFPQTLPAGDNAVNYTLNAPDLFGGDEGEGGVKGTLEFWYGKATQNASAVLAAKVGEAVSRYKRICHFVFYNATYGTSPYLRPFWAIVRRCPVTVSPNSATANINGSANPADAIFEIMTDAFWGLGQSPANFDIPTFTAGAVTFKAEGMGVDFTLAGGQDAASNIIAEIQRHCDCVVYTHPETGKISLKMIRADYDPLTLPHVNKTNAQLTSYKRSTWPETFNEIKVTFVNRGTLPAYSFVRDSTQAQNLAAKQAMGYVASDTIDFPMFSNGTISYQAAFRSLRVTSTPLASVGLRVNRKLHKLTVGNVFILDWPAYGISGLIMRVMSMNRGTLDDNGIEIQAVEDVFATAPAVFTAPPVTSWTLPPTVALPHLRAIVIPAPYYLTRADQFYGLAMVVRQGGSSTSWDGTYNNDPTVPDTPVSGVANLTTGSGFCPAGTLVALYPYNTAYQDEVGFLVNDLNQDMANLIGTDAAGLARGDLLAWIASADGGEVIAWRDIVPQATAGQYLIKGVLRGQFDTAPLDHKIGDSIYFFYPNNYVAYFPGMDTTTVPPTATSMNAANKGFKFWPALNGISSSLPAAIPAGKVQGAGLPNTPATDSMRAALPAPVGDTRLNTIKNKDINPATTLPDNNALTWVSRNKTTQTTPVAHDAAGVAAEAGETYDVDVVHVSRTTGAPIFGTIHQFVGVASPLNYSNSDFETDIKALNGGVKVPDADARRTGGGIRFLIRSKNGTKKSYDVALPGFRRDQQAGYPIIPSLQFTNIAALLVPAEPPFIEKFQQNIDVIST
jgi:hypothetical protein